MKNTNEQLLELSKLLDNKRITQEEFDVLKKELLKNDNKNKGGLNLGTPTAIAGGRKPMKPTSNKKRSQYNTNKTLREAKGKAEYQDTWLSIMAKGVFAFIGIVVVATIIITAIQS